MAKKTGAKRAKPKKNPTKKPTRLEQVKANKRRDQVCVGLFRAETAKIDAFRKRKHPGMSRSRVIRFYAFKGMGIDPGEYKRANQAKAT
jgi:hypothetical protein